jgi:hypothetical protein
MNSSGFAYRELEFKKVMNPKKPTKTIEVSTFTLNKGIVPDSNSIW